MNNGDKTTMDRINEDKVIELVRTLEVSGGAHYALGWIRSMIAAAEHPLKLNKRQIKAFNQMLDDNIRLAGNDKQK